MKLIFLLFISLFLFSCEHQNAKMDRIGERDFYSGFKSSQAQIETIDGKEYICFADYQTHNKIVIHELNKPENIFEIPLNVLDTMDNVFAFEVINLNKVLLLSLRKNKIYQLDRSGSLVKVIQLPHFHDENEFELERSSEGFAVNDTTMIFSITLLFPENIDSLDIEDDEKWKLYYEKKHNFHKWLKVENIFSDSLKIELMGSGFYNRIFPEHAVSVPVEKLAVYEDKMLYCTSFSDSVYVLSDNNIQSFKVNSKYTSTRVPYTFVGDNPADLNENFKRGGQIIRFLWDERNNTYIVYLSHPASGEGRGNRNFSILFFDDNFNLIEEYKMDETRNDWNLFITQEGYLISSEYRDQTKQKYFEVNQYDLYERFD